VSRDEKTYSRIRRQYDAWVTAETSPVRERIRRVDTYSPPTGGNPEMSRTVHAAIGFGIGVLLLALSGYAFSRSGYWGGFGRDGAQVGYALASFFLLIAGSGGIAATWNHNFRVVTGAGGGSSH
jgi:hypothetical protein